MSIHDVFSAIENLSLSILGDIWHWSVYDAGHVFYFWAWPFVVMPALFMRKHLHAAVTAFVWLGVTISVPASGLPEHIVGITSYSSALGVLSLLCLWTWLEFLSLWFRPSVYRSQSWLQLNRNWLLVFLAVAAAMYQIKKEREKQPKLSLRG